MPRIMSAGGIRVCPSPPTAFSLIAVWQKKKKKTAHCHRQDFSYLMEFGLTLARSISPFDDMAMCRL